MPLKDVVHAHGLVFDPWNFLVMVIVLNITVWSVLFLETLESAWGGLLYTPPTPRLIPYNRRRPWNAINVFWNDKKSCSAKPKMDVYSERRWKGSDNWRYGAGGGINVRGLWTWITIDSMEVFNQNSLTQNNLQSLFFLFQESSSEYFCLREHFYRQCICLGMTL